MQTSSEKGEGNPDERANSMEDSPMMTIEYLRARLLSERSVSKAAKERAEELAKRVEELEEQLKIVTFQRKRAEKATLEVLSFLASQGISDISEVYESESDQEESLCESNEGRCDATEEVENIGSLKSKGNNEASGSDHDSTTSSGRALSWKGCKETARSSDKKKIDSSMRRRAGLAQVGSTQRLRPAKSCRQIKKREMRAMVEESRHDSTEPHVQDNKTVGLSLNLSNCLCKSGDELETFADKEVERVLRRSDVSLSLTLQGQECNASSPIHNLGCDGDMERALEHQAQLIGRYEAQEKAQRDWEEKYGENNISTPDSCEPGNHSDVTEERDENKESVPHPIEFVASHGHELKAGIEANLRGKESSVNHFNSFKFTAHADTGCSENHSFSDMQAPRSQAPDFSFSMVNNNQTQEHVVPPSFHSSAQSSQHFAQSAGPTASSPAGSSLCESEQPENLNRHRSFVPKEEPGRLGMVLGALQEAKLLIKQQMNDPPETSSRSIGKAIETSVSGMRDADWLKVPVGCPGLFRVPTNHQSQAPTQNRLLGSVYSSELTNSPLYSRTPLSQGDRYISSPIDSRIGVPTFAPFSCSPVIEAEPGSSTRQSRLDFTFSTGQSSSSKLASPSYPSFPNFLQGISSEQTSYNPALRTEVGMPSSRTGSTLYYGHDVRPNLYR